MELSKDYSCKFSSTELGLILFALQLVIEDRKGKGRPFEDVLRLKHTLYDLKHGRTQITAPVL